MPEKPKEQHPRTCPKCGKIYPWGRIRCNGTPKNHCDTPTIERVEEPVEKIVDEIIEEIIEEVKAKPKKSKKVKK